MSDQDMKLPEGKTCADCAHYKRCEALFDCPTTNTECDWAPSRFRQRVIGLVVKEGHIVTPTGKRFRIEEANNI